MTAILSPNYGWIVTHMIERDGWRYEIVDCNEKQIVIGTEVWYGDPPQEDKESAKGKVVAIGVPDVDFNDEKMRPELYCPKLTIVFGNQETEIANTTNATRSNWSHYPDGPNEYTFQADDLEVVE